MHCHFLVVGAVFFSYYAVLLLGHCCCVDVLFCDTCALLCCWICAAINVCVGYFGCILLCWVVMLLCWDERQRRSMLPSHSTFACCYTVTACMQCTRCNWNHNGDDIVTGIITSYMPDSINSVSCTIHLLV